MTKAFLALFFVANVICVFANLNAGMPGHAAFNAFAAGFCGFALLNSFLRRTW